MALPLTMCVGEQWHGSRKAGSAPCLSGVVPAAQTDQLSYWVDPPYHLPHLRLAGIHEVTGPADLHDFGQQQDI